MGEGRIQRSAIGHGMISFEIPRAQAAIVVPTGEIADFSADA
jgi:hypothetical protein